MKRLSPLCIIALIITFLSINSTSLAQPQPGDVFREYHLTEGGSNGMEEGEWMDEFVFISHHTGERSTPGNRVMEGIDIENAVKAEFVVSFWGGHVGSENRRVVFNDNPPVNLPLIKNAPTQPECYFFQQSAPAADIPLSYLKQGDNEFRLEVDNQICYSFDWGWFWTNQVVLRVYYDPEKVEHPKGHIEEPLSNTTISYLSRVACEIEHGDLQRVEFVGKYEDFSWEGSGEFDTWHGIFWMKDTALQRHIGTASALYPHLNWDNRWIPDQDGIKIAARLIGKDGMIYMTEATENITLDHGKRFVKMYKPQEVPEAFGTQTDSAMCTFQIDDNLEDAFVAKLIVSTFSGGTPDREVYINDVPLLKGGWGLWHRLAFCEEPVPVSILKQGENVFMIKANYPGEHAFEVNWPGPALLVEYIK